MIKENLEIVETNIQNACLRAGRDRSEVTLIAVSKTKPVSDIREAMACGITVFGENKVQEIRDKTLEIKDLPAVHLEPTLDENRTPLGKVLSAKFSKLVPSVNIDENRELLHIAVAVATTLVDRNAQPGDFHASGTSRAHIGVASEIPH